MTTENDFLKNASALLCLGVFFSHLLVQEARREKNTYYLKQTTLGNQWYLNKLIPLFPILKMSPDYLQKLATAQYEERKMADCFETYADWMKAAPSYSLCLKMADLYRKEKNYKEAEINYIRASMMIPSKFFPKEKLLSLYREMGDTLAVKKAARVILLQKEKIPSEEIKILKEEAAKEL